MKSLKGIEREQHFESGGSTAEYIGLHVVHKHKGDKRKNNRSVQKKKAVDESKD